MHAGPAYLLCAAAGGAQLAEETDEDGDDNADSDGNGREPFIQAVVIAFINGYPREKVV